MKKLNFTEEQRKEHAEKAKLARELKKEQASSLKQDFMDKNHWIGLASKYNIRLPLYYAGPEDVPKYLRRTAKALGVELSTYIETTGYTNAKQLAKDNNTWPAYAQVGCMLEWWDEEGYSLQELPIDTGSFIA